VINDILEAITKTITEFTWRRALALVIVAASALGLLVAYESWTSAFRLGRLQKASQILVSLHTVRSDSVRTDSGLVVLSDRLLAQLDSALTMRPAFLPRWTVPQAPRKIRLFLAGGALWWLLGLAMLPGALKRQNDAFAGLLVALLFGGLFGWIGTILPFVAPWVNYGLYPVGHFVGITMFLMRYAKGPRQVS